VKFTFSADEPVNKTYAEYLDLAKGSTLVAEPGKTYDIAPAAGHTWSRATGEVDKDGQPVYEQFEQMPPDDGWSEPADRPRAKTSKES